MAVPIPTNISTLLIAIRAQLAGWTAVGIDISRIRLSAVEDTPHTDAPNDIVLVPDSERKDPKSLGSGRVELRVRRYISVILRTRCALDPINEDTQWLTNPDFGHFQVEDAIVDSMFLFQPVDGIGNALTFEPIIWMHIDRSHRGRAERANDYGFSKIIFDVPYIRTLTQSLNTNLI